jgi:hypothetical protein
MTIYGQSFEPPENEAAGYTCDICGEESEVCFFTTTGKYVCEDCIEDYLKEHVTTKMKREFREENLEKFVDYVWDLLDTHEKAIVLSDSFTGLDSEVRDWFDNDFFESLWDRESRDWAYEQLIERRLDD